MHPGATVCTRVHPSQQLIPQWETIMIRLHLNITEKQSEALKARALETGVQQSEQVRRAINLLLFADAQSENVRVLVAQR